MELIQFSSVVPERENLPYYLISMIWFKNWQLYTGCAPKEELERQQESAPRYPGVINSGKQLEKILDTKFDTKINYKEDLFNNWHLKAGMKED